MTMMTSSNGNIFRVNGHLCGEFTGPGEFPTQRPVTRSFDVFFDLSLNKRLSKQSWDWWSETLSCSLWRHRNDHNKIKHHKTPCPGLYCKWRPFFNNGYCPISTRDIQFQCWTAILIVRGRYRWLVSTNGDWTVRMETGRSVLMLNG